MPTYTPIDITSGYGESTPQAHDTNLPVLFNGVYYYITQDGSAGTTLQVYQSTNQTTWSLVAASQITIESGFAFAQWAVCFDGTNLVVVYNDSSTDTNIHIRKYNLSTLTWGAVATGTFSPGFIYQVIFRAFDSAYIVIVQITGPARYGFYIYNGAWSGFNSGTSGTTNALSVSPQAQVDSNSRIHFFFGTTTSAGTVKHLNYQLINSDNTLGATNDFNLGTVGVINFCVPTIDAANSNVIIYLTEGNNATFYVIWGNGLVTPTWHGPTLIDTVALAQVPFPALISGTLYATAIASGSNIIYQYTTTTLTAPDTGWSAKSTIFDGSLTTIVGWNQNNLFNANVNPRLYFNSFTAGGVGLVYTLAAAPPPSPHGIGAVPLVGDYGRGKAGYGINQKIIAIPEMNSFDEVRQVLARAISEVQNHIATQLPILDYKQRKITNVAPPTEGDDVVTLKYLQSVQLPAQPKSN